MFSLPVWAVIALLVLVSGAADRIIGWGEWGRTKPIIATVLLLLLVAYFAHLPPAAIAAFPVAWMVWRTLPWGFLGGSINPAPSAAFGTLARHAVSIVFLLPAYLAHVSLVLTAVYMLLFSTIATALAIWNYFDKAHANQTVETARGLVLGACLSIAFVIPLAHL